VPGVLLLDAVATAAERWTGSPLCLAGLPAVKFLQPLLPDEEACIALQRDGSQLRFRVLRGDTLLAQGTLELAP
jgi:3-hydroxymyristoyl/3-hydroxydecanoyl-(acyl carrier protein) dehydratase